MHFFIKTCTALVPSGSIDFLTAEWLKQLRAKACIFFFPPVTLSNFISRETVISHCSDHFVSSSLLSDCPADVVLQHCCWRRGNSQKMVICYYKKRKAKSIWAALSVSLHCCTVASKRQGLLPNSFSSPYNLRIPISRMQNISRVKLCFSQKAIKWTENEVPTKNMTAKKMNNQWPTCCGNGGWKAPWDQASHPRGY